MRRGPADVLGLHGPRLPYEHVQHPQDTTAMGDGPRTGRGRPGPVPSALEQHDAQLALDAAHRVRDGGLARAEPTGGGREAALLGDRDEGTEFLRRKIDGAAHCGSPTCCHERELMDVCVP